MADQEGHIKEKGRNDFAYVLVQVVKTRLGGFNDEHLSLLVPESGNPRSG